MVRLNLIFAFIAFSITTFSESKAESVLYTTYHIVSDTINKNVPSGKCLITGKVQANYYNDDLINSESFKDFLIATPDLTKQTHSDSLGQFSLLISEKDTAIFLFKLGFEEIVLYPYDFKNKHEVVIRFYPVSNRMIFTVDKPVIYFYHPSTTTLKVKLNPQSELSFTYPQYNNEWNLTCNGSTLIDENENHYPYLFWEGKTANLHFDKTNNDELYGYLIQTDTLVQFLEHSLSKLNLNSNEKTDFITYWAPQMIYEEFVFIQFLINENYASKINLLEIEPKPETLIQVFMMYTPIKNASVFQDFKEQELPSLQRSGFTVIEWGGAKLNQKII